MSKKTKTLSNRIKKEISKLSVSMILYDGIDNKISIIKMFPVEALIASHLLSKGKSRRFVCLGLIE